MAGVPEHLLARQHPLTRGLRARGAASLASFRPWAVTSRPRSTSASRASATLQPSSAGEPRRMVSARWRHGNSRQLALPRRAASVLPRPFGRRVAPAAFAGSTARACRWRHGRIIASPRAVLILILLIDQGQIHFLRLSDLFIVHSLAGSRWCCSHNGKVAGFAAPTTL